MDEIIVDGVKYRKVTEAKEKPKLVWADFRLHYDSDSDEIDLVYQNHHVLTIQADGKLSLAPYVPVNIGLDVDDSGTIRIDE